MWWRTSSGPAITSNPAPRRRAQNAVHSSPSLNMPSAIAWPSVHNASIARRTIASVGGGMPRRRAGHASMRPFDHHLARDLHERERLGDEIVGAARARAEALHDLLERARLRRERPARVVLPRASSASRFWRSGSGSAGHSANAPSRSRRPRRVWSIFERRRLGGRRRCLRATPLGSVKTAAA